MHSTSAIQKLPRGKWGVKSLASYPGPFAMRGKKAWHQKNPLTLFVTELCVEPDILDYVCNIVE